MLFRSCVTTGVRRSGITTTCSPLSSVKLAGRSDVTVVWANALPAEKANVEMKTATREAAKRCGDIMTYLARMPQNG